MVVWRTLVGTGRPEGRPVNRQRCGSDAAWNDEGRFGAGSAEIEHVHEISNRRRVAGSCRCRFCDPDPSEKVELAFVILLPHLEKTMDRVARELYLIRSVLTEPERSV